MATDNSSNSRGLEAGTEPGSSSILLPHEGLESAALRLWKACLRSFDQLPWGECAVATSWDTLEHSPRPRLFLERLARLLRPGGRLYLTTLNNDAIVARVFRTRWSMLVEDHFTYWNLRSLTRALSVTGFEIRSVWHFGLGRDFAPWSRRRHAEQSHRPGGGGDLMASSSLVAVEQLVNRLLNSTHLGVGIGVEARRLLRP